MVTPLAFQMFIIYSSLWLLLLLLLLQLLLLLLLLLVVVMIGSDSGVVGWQWGGCGGFLFFLFFSSGAFSVAEDGRLFFFGNEMMMGTMMDGGGLWCQTGVNGCAVTSRLGPLLSASMPGSRFAAFRLPMDCFMELNESLYIDISCGGGWRRRRPEGGSGEKWRENGLTNRPFFSFLAQFQLYFSQFCSSISAIFEL